MPAVNVFDMGIRGVNLVRDPLQLEPGELIQAQNGEPFRDRGVAGIRKRPGLQKVVPTGSVAPGAALGAVTGSIGILGSFGSGLSPDMLRYYLAMSLTGGFYSLNGGASFSAFTSPTGTTSPSETAPLLGLAPNVKYKLTATSPYEFLALYPACRFDGLLVFGGHESGQILGFNGTSIIELGRLAATGSVDDTLPLPNTFINDVQLLAVSTTTDGNTVATQYETQGYRRWVMVALVGGGMQLFDPYTRDSIKLPSLGATITGAICVGNTIFAVSGLSVSSIRVGVETAWTTRFTAADVGVSQLTGIAGIGAFFYVGTKIGTVLTPLRVYKLAYGSSDALTRVQVTGSDSLQINQTTAPSYFYGPFNGVDGLYGVYLGTTAALIGGSEGGLGTASNRAIIAGSYSNGHVGSWTQDLDITAGLGASSSITLGPILAGKYGQYFYARYNTTDLAVFRRMIYASPAGSANVWNAIRSGAASVEMIYPFFGD